jgi:hypothetical protein
LVSWQLLAYGRELRRQMGSFCVVVLLISQHYSGFWRGGRTAHWRGDGREIFFLDLEGKMMSPTFERGSAPKIGTPRQLFATRLIPDPTINQYAVTADGHKFLVLESRKGFNETHSVVLNWPATVK